LAKKTDEEIKLDDGGEGYLTRNVRVERGRQVVTGDYMVLNYKSGEREDVLVIDESGKRKVKLFDDGLGAITSSPAVNATLTISGGLVDVDADTEKRLLEIYDRFPTAAA
jgi:hypothetical protein